VKLIIKVTGEYRSIHSPFYGWFYAPCYKNESFYTIIPLNIVFAFGIWIYHELRMPWLVKRVRKLTKNNPHTIEDK
jgi:hypothetical protein